MKSILMKLLGMITGLIILGIINTAIMYWLVPGLTLTQYWQMEAIRTVTAIIYAGLILWYIQRRFVRSMAKYLNQEPIPLDFEAHEEYQVKQYEKDWENEKN